MKQRVYAQRGIFPSLVEDEGIKYTTSVERDFIMLVDSNPATKLIERGSAIRYGPNGKKRYTPDYHVVIETRNFLVECKLEKYKYTEANLLTYQVGKTWCNSQENWFFMVITDWDMRKNPFHLRNLYFLRRYARLRPSTHELRSLIAIIQQYPDGLSIEALVSFFPPEDKRRVTHLVYYLAYYRYIEFPILKEHISLQTIFRVPEE